MGRIKAFLLGGLIGAGAALILAPQAGEQTRAMVAEKAGALAGEAKDFGAGLPDSATDLYKNLVDRGGSLVQDAQGAGDAALKADQDELREKIEAARQRIAAQVMENAEKAQEATEVEAAAEAAPADAASDEAKHAK